MTPHQKWGEGIQSSGFPMVPPFTPAMDRLFLRMHPQTRTVQSRGIPAFGLHYWSAGLGGLERIDHSGRAVQYNFRYDPADISRIALFCNGEWVGDGYARELQQADGSYLHLGLAEWKRAKQHGWSHHGEQISSTAEELALMADLKALGQRRTHEKKAAQRAKPKPAQRAEENPRERREQASEHQLDEETERVLRFLHR